MLTNVLGNEAAGPFYIWGNDDCANKEDDFKEAKRIRCELIAGGAESVYIVDADGVEVVDGEIVSEEATAAVIKIDNALDGLFSILDASGALEAENTQRAAYRLRLEVVRALGDSGRVQAAQASLAELDGQSGDVVVLATAG